jgi:hypothetical protein
VIEIDPAKLDIFAGAARMIEDGIQQEIVIFDSDLDVSACDKCAKRHQPFF